MTREEFAGQCERGAAAAPALPVTAAILRWTAEQLKRGEPPWWKVLAKAWEKRRFVAWTEAWGLYLAALHFEALSDADSPLVPFFPSCGGTAEADPSPGLARFLAAPTASFLENLRGRQRRTYVAARATLWTGPAMLFFQRRGLPYYLVEVNAGAGLDLGADLVARPKGFDPELVAARIGLDEEPLELSDVAQRRWLTAAIPPDDKAAIAQLDAAIEALRKRSTGEAAFVQLAACPQEKAPAFVAKNVPADDPDVGLLIFNMGTTVRMTDPEYAAFAAAMTQTLKPWGDRGLWVEAEHVRGEAYSTTFQLRAHRFTDGQPRSFVMASFDVGSARPPAYQPASAAFLEVKPPPRPGR